MGREREVIRAVVVRSFWCWNRKEIKLAFYWRKKVILE